MIPKEFKGVYKMRAAIFLLALMFLGPYSFFSDGALRQDFSLKQETLVPALMPTTDRECTSTLGIFHQCSFKYSAGGEAQKQKYNMFAFGAPDTLVLLRGVESGRLTTTTGQDYFWNRLFTIITLLLLSFFTFIGVVKRLLSEATPSEPHGARAQSQAPQATALNQRVRANNRNSGFGTRSSS